MSAVCSADRGKVEIARGENADRFALAHADGVAALAILLGAMLMGVVFGNVNMIIANVSCAIALRSSSAFTHVAPFSQALIAAA